MRAIPVGHRFQNLSDNSRRRHEFEKENGPEQSVVETEAGGDKEHKLPKEPSATKESPDRDANESRINSHFIVELSLPHPLIVEDIRRSTVLILNQRVSVCHTQKHNKKLYRGTLSIS